MNMKKTTALSAIAILALAGIALGSVLGVVWHRVKEFDRKHGSDVLANLDSMELFEKTNIVEKAAGECASGDGETPAESTPAEMKVLEVRYKGEKEIKVVLSDRPDMDVVRNYVSVEPLAEGRVSFGYSASYNHKIGDFQPVLRITGEFAFRTNVTLRIMKGLPLYGKGANPNAEGSLKEDFVHVFRRNDSAPYVGFADDGRYLAPLGLRAIAIESMNVTNVTTEIRRIEPANVVQMLAREESVYSRHSDWYDEGADCEATAELAGEAETNVLRCANMPNEKERHMFAVAMNDGKPKNGIYFVRTLMADHPQRDRVYYWEDGVVANPARCRVVCVSDLALSVRRWHGGKLGVWVVSLATGRPVEGVEITVRSSANIKIMEGMTDAKGWCEPERCGNGEPFAIIGISPDADDMTFMALRDSMTADETYRDGARKDYLSPKQTAAFLWTERGIYRHGEKIFMHAIFRDGTRNAPRPFPVEFTLDSPDGKISWKAKGMTGVNGTAYSDAFSVPDDQPGGVWTFRAVVPGSTNVLGETKVKIEEFAPPQIRVEVGEDASLDFPSFGFAVSAEHLFGGPAHNLACEGAVVFEDVPFAPAGWKGWSFGNEMLGLKPSFRRLKSEGVRLDRSGKAVFDAPLFADSGLPKAAVRVTAQGTVFEDGGRPATARKSVVRHYYPYYIGSTLGSWMKRPQGGRVAVDFACLAPDGTRLAESKKLSVKIERIDSFYSYKKDNRGWATWNCERVRSAVADGIGFETSADSNTRWELPLDECGDYAITVKDEVSGVSFGREFYLSDWGDNVVRAPLANPTEVTLTPDKAWYRTGEKPRMIVKSPFAGEALVSVMRDGMAYTEILQLTNATSEITLRPVRACDAPNLDVYVSVVQGVAAGEKRLAVRARGQATVAVRPEENEIAVGLSGKVEIGEKGSRVSVEFEAPGATEAGVTLVDEGINLLTGEETPDPVGFFAMPRGALHPLYDIYHRVLPVLGKDAMRAGGIKTGGGFGAEMLSRVSPVPTRRFKPLAMWNAKVSVKDGKGRAEFVLPEFVGEVRVTAVACNAKATGSGSIRLKVSPKLVAMPDAPRFVAPGDRFGVSLPVYNRAGKDGEFGFAISAGGKRIVEGSGCILGKDCATNIVCFAEAPGEPGEMEIKYEAKGFGENHVSVIRLPVRPAVAWRETAGVKRLSPGEKFEPEEGRFVHREYDSPMGGLAHALEWLSEYPYGCLEQTVSRIFPVIAAGGILATVEIPGVSNRADVVKAGVKRVESMVREHDFTMWPDSDYAPWDKEVSLYAAHFLAAAEKAGEKVDGKTKGKVAKFLSGWAASTNDSISAYAVHTLALAGRADKDRMFRLYDSREKLSLLSRARLASAFAAIGDRDRARTLLANAASPSDVKEASFALTALLETDPSDPRAELLVRYLDERRDGTLNTWGTTEGNAHALIAMGEYYRHHPPVKGERFVAWRKLELPPFGESKAESNGLSVVRRFLTPEGEPADVKNLKCGEMVISEIAIESRDGRDVGDLVIEELFAGALEPVLGGKQSFPAFADEIEGWVMRSDARDDRMLVFSKRFRMEPGMKAVFRHPLRVVSPGDYALPGVSVEAMYYPALNARSAPQRITIPGR